VHPQFKELLSEAELCQFAKKLWKAQGTQNGEDGPVRTSRGSFEVVELGPELKVLVRSYMRGGFVQHFVKDRFFCLPWESSDRSRPFQEFAMLQRLKEHGVNVPLPVGAATFYETGHYSYRGIIASEYIENSENLLERAVLCRDAAERDDEIFDAAYAAGVEAGRMLDAKVMHRDLHPANVLMLPSSEIVLIDFDKAFQFGDLVDKPLYAQRIAARWARSCAKHSLSPRFVDRFLQGLLGKEEQE
jgi:3-deoxy-D-manno-octulosonic acid kinase